jgi:hypothetical protein
MGVDDLMKWITEENLDLKVAPVFFYIYEFRPRIVSLVYVPSAVKAHN